MLENELSETSKLSGFTLINRVIDGKCSLTATFWGFYFLLGHSLLIVSYWAGATYLGTLGLITAKIFMFLFYFSIAFATFRSAKNYTGWWLWAFNAKMFALSSVILSGYFVFEIFLKFI